VEVQALQVLCEAFARTQTLPLEARCSVSSSTWIGGFWGGRLSSLRRGRVNGLRGNGRRGWCRPWSRRERGVWLLRSPLPLLIRRTGVVRGVGVDIVSRGGLVRLLASYAISFYKSFTLRRSVLSLRLFLFQIVLSWFRRGVVSMMEAETESHSLIAEWCDMYSLRVIYKMCWRQAPLSLREADPDSWS